MGKININQKSVNDFYNELLKEVEDRFNCWDNYGMFEDFDNEQKKDILRFANVILNVVYNPIQKFYTKKERKKYDKLYKDCKNIFERQRTYTLGLETRCKKYNDENEFNNSRVRFLLEQIAKKDDEIKELKQKLNINELKERVAK